MSSVTCEVNPGASTESVLVTTDSCENFEQMTSSLEEIKNTNSISTTEENIENCNNIDGLDDNSCGNMQMQDDDYVRSKEWIEKRKHIFVLSSAGKPIYSR